MSIALRTLVAACALVCGTAEIASAQEAAPESPVSGPTVKTQPRHGLTFEANLGLGWLNVDPNGGGGDTELAPLGVGFGVGVWASPNVAATLRVAGVTYFEEGGQIVSSFVGPSLQAWFHDSAWLGVGIGMGAAKVFLDDFPDSDIELGLAFDVRLGVTPLVFGDSSLNVSVEATPVLLDGGSFTGASILVGYQYL